jgi:broad specificity polyphosphatase/5'/3'-nucleotidase SurE
VAFLKEAKEPGGTPRIDASPAPHADDLADPTTDVHALRVSHLVSVTPLSLDLTSRVNMDDLQKLMG